MAPRPWLYYPIRASIAPLVPQAVAGFRKVRVGRQIDGGYVQLDHFDGLCHAISIGIGSEDSWDLAIARRGIPVLQYDHTVVRAPSSHPACSFFQKKIVPVLPHGEGETTLAEIVGDLTGDLILKMDVEGDEWTILEAIDAATLNRFRQITCEFHGLFKLRWYRWRQRIKAVFRKLARTHAVIHVHGNNNGRAFMLGRILIPDVIEVTFVRASHYQLRRSEEEFPTALDRPNRLARPDIPLTNFLRGGKRWWMV